MPTYTSVVAFMVPTGWVGTRWWRHWVFGRRAGEAAARWSWEHESQLRSKPVIDEAHDDLDSLIHPGTELSRALHMWRGTAEAANVL